MKWGGDHPRAGRSLLLGRVRFDRAGDRADGSAYAQTVNSIVVEGNRRVEANTIRSYFKPGPDGRIGAFQIDEAYKALLATGLFEDVRIQTAGGRIVVGWPKIRSSIALRLRAIGGSRTTSSSLRSNRSERGTFSRPVVQSDVQRIVEVYRRSGRYDIRVNPVDHRPAQQPRRSRVRGQRGCATNIRTIEFVGNRIYSSFRLKEMMRTAESGLLSFLQSNNIYDPDRIEADRELLRRFYLKHGYIDVRIMAPAVEFDPGARGFVVKFIIEEGEQFRVGTVDVRSNVRALDPGLVRSRLRVSPGEVFNTEAVEKTVEDMTIEAARQGFAFATVRPRADRNCAGPYRQPRLHDRGGASRLHRADQYPRQHPHPRSCDPPRVRCRRR